MIIREQIYQNLLELLITTGDFKIAERRVRLPDEIAPTDMPYLGLLQLAETARTERGMPIRWTFNPTIYIHVSTGNSTKVNPYSILNPILDNISELFNAHNLKLYQGVQTLDGLVGSVKLQGGFEIHGGLMGTKAMAIIPLEILVNR